jgi:hypothetical protein
VEKANRFAAEPDTVSFESFFTKFLSLMSVQIGRRNGQL